MPTYRQHLLKRRKTNVRREEKHLIVGAFSSPFHFFRETLAGKYNGFADKDPVNAPAPPDLQFFYLFARARCSRPCHLNDEKTPAPAPVVRTKCSSTSAGRETNRHLLSIIINNKISALTSVRRLYRISSFRAFIIEFLAHFRKYLQSNRMM